MDSDFELRGVIPRAAAEIFSHIGSAQGDKETFEVTFRYGMGCIGTIFKILDGTLSLGWRRKKFKF